MYLTLGPIKEYFTKAFLEFAHLHEIIIQTSICLNNRLTLTFEIINSTATIRGSINGGPPIGTH